MLEYLLNKHKDDDDLGLVWLHVISTNTSAIKFYFKNGFYSIDYLFDYYEFDSTDMKKIEGKSGDKTKSVKKDDEGKKSAKKTTESIKSYDSLVFGK